MILGQVSARYEAIIPIKIYDVNRQIVDLDATVDTGFSGYLTLPTATIRQLQLTYDRTETYTLGDNNDVDFDLYRGMLFWDGQDRNVFVLSTESEPLIGMSSLHGYTLFIDVVDGGAIRIAVRP
jgi:clan AA aspartic protease